MNLESNGYRAVGRSRAPLSAAMFRASPSRLFRLVSIVAMEFSGGASSSICSLVISGFIFIFSPPGLSLPGISNKGLFLNASVKSAGTSIPFFSRTVKYSNSGPNSLPR